MKKIYILIISLLIFIPNSVLANRIKNINMNIYVDINGTAHVTEEWDTVLNKGTEGYKPYYNLGQSKISNFKVNMNGKEYSYYEDWNANGNFNEKKYKNGLNYINDGIELCFGISEYGNNKYTLTYDISNFVVKTSDEYQMIYWNLFPYNYDPLPEKVYIKIYSDFKYPNTLDIWGYGKYGAPCYIYNGFIEMESNGKLKKDEYMTILAKFDPYTFETNTSVDNTFEYYYNISKQGSKEYKKEEDSLLKSLAYILGILSLLACAYVLLIKVSNNIRSKFVKNENRFMGEKIKNKDVQYCREIPYDIDDITKIYWIAKQYNLTNNNNQLLGAIFLKWMKNGNILLNTSSNNEKTIVLKNKNNLNKREEELYDMLISASDNYIITKKNLTTWCKKNCSKFLGWFDYSLQDIRISMTNNGYIFNESYDKFVIGPLLNEEAKKMIGLKKYLIEFSKIKERNSNELIIWQDYMIYAVIFGIADKVINELNKIYPNIIPSNIYNDISFIENISEKTYTISFDEQKRIEIQEEKKTHGGSGFSSGGGGGGSFGGGGGGGGFR